MEKTINIFNKTVLRIVGPGVVKITSADSKSLKTVEVSGTEEINIDLGGIRFEEIYFVNNSSLGETTLKWISENKDTQNFSAVPGYTIECRDELKSEYLEVLQFLVNRGYQIELPVVGGDYLCFENAYEDHSKLAYIKLSQYVTGIVEISEDKQNWRSITWRDGFIPISDKLYMRGSGHRSLGTRPFFDDSPDIAGGLLGVNLSGSIMSMCGDPELTYFPDGEGAINFQGGDVTDASRLRLPATELYDGCYRGMFANSSLVKAPSILPATSFIEKDGTYATSVYREMFFNCAMLTEAPELPATTLSPNCYGDMFSYCSSLVNPPTVLPAATLVLFCYEYMFRSCERLVSAPEIMISSINPVAGELDGAMRYMFYRCSSLQEIKIHTSNWRPTVTENWVRQVKSGGTFYKKSSTVIPAGDSGIPESWTIINF